MNLCNEPGEMLWLTLEQVEQIRRQAAAKPNQEICGLLAGAGGSVARVYPVSNVAPYPASSYYMDPLEQLNALSDIDEHGWDLLAAYHSHPCNGPSFPSPTDIALSSDSMLLHLIVVISGDGLLTSCRAFRIADDHVTEVALQIADAGGPQT